MKSLVGVVLLYCAIGVYSSPISSRVVGGSNADDGKYPYQVVLRYGAMFLCGGSILNQQYILTAAHCVYKRKAQMITITTGTNDIQGTGGKFYFAKNLIVHENFTSMNVEDIADDIALIRVDGDIEFNERVQAIDLPTTNFDTYNSPAILTGWGRTDAAAANPKKLQEIELTVITQQSCKTSWEQILDTHICTLTKVGEGACSGDSGGPLVSEGVQIGIVSFGKACAQGVPDVFTRVFSYLDWIKIHMTK